ncbi:hypothetical protein QIH85_23970 [Bradyrhizobium japonicum]|uniref:hypothetical protein n=1 Tax=Bradyrhizobium japonicum TaxID=375 RepID=UPI002714DA15|nr:hypothetical protein [Bradyrhizobium japonicum]WLB24941.1 hypothetical protein QIH85_23970 [Bradyrhizobium japonicum]
MSQNARVARWVPTVDPDSVGENVVTQAASGPNNVIPTKFAIAGGAGGVAWATDAEMQTGTETLKAVAPATYRDELVRLLNIPNASFNNPVAIAVRTGTPANDSNRLVKTDSLGLLDAGFMPAIIDGGTF